MPEPYEKPKRKREPKFKPAISVDELRQLDEQVTDPVGRRLLWEIYRLRAEIAEIEKLVAEMQRILKKGAEG